MLFIIASSGDPWGTGPSSIAAVISIAVLAVGGYGMRRRHVNGVKRQKMIELLEHADDVCPHREDTDPRKDPDADMRWVRYVRELLSGAYGSNHARLFQRLTDDRPQGVRFYVVDRLQAPNGLLARANEQPVAAEFDPTKWPYFKASDWDDDDWRQTAAALKKRCHVGLIRRYL